MVKTKLPYVAIIISPPSNGWLHRRCDQWRWDIPSWSRAWRCWVPPVAGTPRDAWNIHQNWLQGISVEFLGTQQSKSKRMGCNRIRPSDWNADWLVWKIFTGIWLVFPIKHRVSFKPVHWFNILWLSNGKLCVQLRISRRIGITMHYEPSKKRDWTRLNQPSLTESSRMASSLKNKVSRTPNSGIYTLMAWKITIF